jgi:hypothetical protein
LPIAEEKRREEGASEEEEGYSKQKAMNEVDAERDRGGWRSLRSLRLAVRWIDVMRRTGLNRRISLGTSHIMTQKRAANTMMQRVVEGLARS